MALIFCLSCTAFAAKKEEERAFVEYSDHITLMVNPEVDLIYDIAPDMTMPYGVVLDPISSNPSVVKKATRAEIPYIALKPLKPGCATITLRFLDWETGKQIKKYIKVKVVKYNSPFNTFKLGKTNIRTLLGNKFRITKVHFPEGKAFVNIKLKKGWKLWTNPYSSSYMYGKYRFKKDKYGEPAITEPTIKNQRIFNFNAKNIKWQYMNVTVMNSNTGIRFSYDIYPG